MQANERVLLVASTKASLARAATRVLSSGGEAIAVGSVAEAKRLAGAFDRGIFTFDLPDGSGIVLAAEMVMDSRIREIEFIHPADELVARDPHPSGVRSASATIDSQELARNVA